MKPVLHATVPVRRRSAGAGLVTAIFLLVVLAGLAVALVSIVTAQRQAILLDEQGVRAYQAARAGIEWGLFQRLRGSGCPDGVVNTVAMGQDSVLAGFTVTVTCTFVDWPGAGNDLDRWNIRASACAPADGTACPAGGSANPDYVRRDIEVQI